MEGYGGNVDALFDDDDNMEGEDLNFMNDEEDQGEDPQVLYNKEFVNKCKLSKYQTMHYWNRYHYISFIIRIYWLFMFIQFFHLKITKKQLNGSLNG